MALPLSRRRLLEIAFAVVVLLVLLTVLMVRQTARRTSPPPIPLLVATAGAPPDFSSGSYDLRVARSPDNTRSAVLYPVEFETPSDLYVMSGPGEGRHYLLADSLRGESNLKAVGWIDASTLWVTVGWLYGTVSPGGELLAVDPGTGMAAPLWASPDSGRTQAVGALALPGGRLEVRLVRFDPAMDHPADSSLVLSRTALEAARQSLARPRGG